MIGKVIRLLRVAQELNQTEVAARLEISRSYLSEIEAGHKVPTIDLLKRIASVLGVPTSSLMLLAEQFEQGSLPHAAQRGAGERLVKMLEQIAEARARDVSPCEDVAEKNG